MADRDIFTKGLGPHWSSVGRKAASPAVTSLGLALSACHAINSTLNSGGGIPRALYAGLCDVIAAARDDKENLPLFDDSSSHYEKRQQLRQLRAAFPGMKLGSLLVEAASRVLVEERTRTAADLPTERQSLALSIQMEVFEERFAGPVISLLQQEGLSAEQARQRVDDCRDEMVRLEEFHRLTRSISRRPEATRRRIGSPRATRVVTKDLLHQPVVGLMAGAGASRS